MKQPCSTAMDVMPKSVREKPEPDAFFATKPRLSFVLDAESSIKKQDISTLQPEKLSSLMSSLKDRDEDMQVSLLPTSTKRAPSLPT
jgi:hypothetical protein